MPATNATFSTFIDGGNAQSTDIVVGLRNGLNYRFNLSGIVGAFLPLAGGTMSGDINMAGNTITQVPSPSASSDVVPKSYVDALTAGEALTKVDDTNVTLALGGTPTTALLHATSLTLGWTGQLSLARGGTNANLTASANSLVYSTASALALLATANNGVLVTSAGGVPSISSTLPDNLVTSDPTLTQGIATKHYVDQNSLNGTSVYAASAASLGTVTQSGAGVGATLTNAGVQATFALDGVNPPVGVNVLIKDTAVGMTAANEGIYTVTDPGSGASNWVLTRAIGYDTTTEINNTGLIVIQNGSTLAGTAWYNASTIVTVDTTAFSYSQFGNIIFPLTLAQGGTGASLVASNGGIFYSTGTTGAILAGTATANKMLLSGATAPPSWSTSTIPSSAGATAGKALVSDGTNYVLSSFAFPTSVGATGTLLRSDGTNWAATTSTYPNTNAINTLLYASSANVMSALATVNSATLTTSSTGVPTWSGTMTNGQIIIGSTGATPVAATLTQGTGITITNGAGTITIAAAVASPINQVVTQVFTGSGTYTPTTGMKYCVIECVGGGGGGGGTANSGATASLGVGGGGSGSYSRKTSTAAAIGASQTVTIGAAGTAGANTGGAGGNGGDTSVGTICIGKGGTGGGGSGTGFTGGAGGVAGTGDFVPVGNSGGSGIITVTSSSSALSGFGAASYMGGGVAGRTTQGAGTNGAAYGAGGSGAFSTAAGGAAAGGTGAAGVVIITEYLSV